MTSGLDVELSRVVDQVHAILWREVDLADPAGSLERVGEVRDALGSCVMDSFFAEAMLIGSMVRSGDEDAAPVGR